MEVSTLYPVVDLYQLRQFTLFFQRDHLTMDLSSGSCVRYVIGIFRYLLYNIQFETMIITVPNRFLATIFILNVVYGILIYLYLVKLALLWKINQIIHR